MNEAVAGLKSARASTARISRRSWWRASTRCASRRGTKAEFDETIDKMIGGEQFDAAKIRADQVARTGGAPDTAE